LRWLPDAITFSRLLCAPILSWLILTLRFREALGLVLRAGLTDWFDGFAARRLGTSGHLGVVLDPLADKILLITLFVVVTMVRLIPAWVFVLVCGRDAVIVAGALAIRWLRGPRRFLPSLWGKISTFFQIMLILVVLVHAILPNELFALLKSAAIILTAIFTALSGADYVRRGWFMAAGAQVQPPKT
jgi:cardiolipin synthase (CMP-forming)